MEERPVPTLTPDLTRDLGINWKANGHPLKVE